jgi:murein hydrolase activator
MFYLLKTDIKIAFFTGCIILVLSHSMIFAQSRGIYKDNKQDIKKKIAKQTKLLESFFLQESKIIEDLNNIDYTLNQTRLQVAAISKELTTFKNKIEQLIKNKNHLADKINLNQEYAGQRLKALYKMDISGRLKAAGLPDSLFDFFLKQNAMERIIAADFNLLAKQNQDLKKFETFRQQIQEQIHIKTNLETQLNNQIMIHKQQASKKQLMLQGIRKKKKLSFAVVETLNLAAMKLESQITDIGKNNNKAGFNAFSFSNSKGKLQSPVNGKIISKYGPLKKGSDNAFTFQKGIDIKVARGEPVKSIFKGEILFAQWLKGYGNLVIIDHGDSYYTLYAHVEDIFKKKGEKVETGEVIATAGDTGSIKGVCLHFEVRHHGKPVNPIKWLKKG